MSEQSPELTKRINQEYQHGFVTDIETEQFAPGLNESVITRISKKKNETF